MDNKTISLPVTKQEVVLKSFMTGRDKQAIQDVYFQGVEMDVDETGKSSQKIDPKAIGNSATNKAIEIVVVSVGGVAEGVVDLVLDLPVQDYDLIVDEVNKITEPISAQEKKDSANDTPQPSSQA